MTATSSYEEDRGTTEKYHQGWLVGGWMSGFGFVVG
ncbi:hypothetical protein M0802_007198 [Mischocyttarus mexicanus]|nr:hypothetical protein M0802_007198 [Mischocyttarus mexicanus]